MYTLKQIIFTEDIETRFYTWHYELNRTFPKRRKKVIAWIRDELGRKIMTKFVRLRAKTYSYLKDDGIVIKRKLKYENYTFKLLLLQESIKNS